MVKQSLSEVERLARRVEGVACSFETDVQIVGSAAAKLRELERDYWELDADFLSMEAAAKKLGAERDEARALADKLYAGLVSLNVNPANGEGSIEEAEAMAAYAGCSWRSKKEST